MMYTVTKRIEISAAHRLELDYESPCCHLHGHNWIIEVTCKSEELNNNGMVVDFTELKRFVKDTFDHQLINNIFGLQNPTAENIAKFICDNIPHCVKVSVQESEGNVAIYDKY